MTDQALRLLLVDDDEVVRESLRDFLRRLGHEVTERPDGESAVETVSREDADFDIAFVDVRMPGIDGLETLGALRRLRPELKVVLVTGHGTLDTAVEALRLGAEDFLRKPVNLSELEAVVDRIRKVLAHEAREQQLTGALRSAQSGRYVSDTDDPVSTIIGGGPAIQRVRESVRLAAASECTGVVLTGETGTGKEVVARALHAASRGASAPFIPVNCPALPESLAEAEIFGHAKGAFTGATEERLGAFELADGGTLFLDEIADLSTTIQPKLLRVLESRQVRRIGADRERTVDVRVIAASNVDLNDQVEAGALRRDLYYRLNVFQIHMPPLRERPEDVLPLAEHFLARVLREGHLPPKTLTDEAAGALRGYAYPGNARELRNIIERSVMLSPGTAIPASALGLSATPAAPQSPPQETGTPLPAGLQQQCEEARAIQDALARCGGNRRRAAEALGLTYAALRWRIRKYGIDASSI